MNIFSKNTRVFAKNTDIFGETIVDFSNHY